MSKDITPQGYDEESRFFHEQDMKLLREKRAQLDAARQKLAAEEAKGAHWLRCPKCGGQMEEIKLDNVLVDKCTGCEGIFFDKGELELLIQERRGGFLSRLFK